MDREEMLKLVNAENAKQDVKFGAGGADEATGQKKKPRFHFKAASELIACFAGIKWIIKGIIEKDTMMMLFAEAGSYKSFIILDMAFAIVAMLSWHGHLIKEKGPVFYICGEGHQGIARRLRALEIHYGISVSGLPLYVSSQPAAFLKPDGAAEVVNAIESLTEEHGTPIFVIVDTLSRNFGPGDENATKDMSQFISTLDTDIRAKYGCAISVVHHTGLNAKDRGRGSGALRGALDFEYLVTKNQNGTRTMTPKKVKDHAEPKSISFRAEEIQIPEWLDEDTGEPLTSLVMIPTTDTGVVKGAGAKLTGQKKVAYEILTELLKDARADIDMMDMNKAKVHVNVWRDACYNGGLSTSQNANTKWHAFDTARKNLLTMDIIKTADDFYWMSKEG